MTRVDPTRCPSAKAAFSSPQEAYRAAQLIGRDHRDRRGMRHYRCPFCTAWHLTHARKGRRPSRWSA